MIRDAMQRWPMPNALTAIAADVGRSAPLTGTD
jgi:hypothetical protein